MNFNAFMSSAPLRADILDDLTYLQKHLRLIIKYHQKLSSRLYVSTGNQDGILHSPIQSRNFGIIRQLMDELEIEMEDISKEQKMLTDIVKNAMTNHCIMLKRKKKVEVESDIVNGFVTRALQHHYEKNYFNIMPSNVKARMSEDELKKKFNKVKGDCAKEREELLRFKTEPSTSTTVKRESLLKPQFRKPTSGHVQKKLAVKATVVTESRRPKAKPTAAKPNTESITHSRLNLLRALTKVKTEQVDNKEGLDRYYTERCRATLAETGEDGRHVKYLRSDEDWSDKSSSYDGIDGEVDPLKGRRGRKRRSPQTHSEESSESDYKKKYPNLHIEPPPKTEYTQEEFLQYFKIITPQVAELLKLRRSERKRRNCTKNEKNDYHYGNFDLNEVAFRVRLSTNKKSILYSPNNKILQARNGR